MLTQQTLVGGGSQRVVAFVSVCSFSSLHLARCTHRRGLWQWVRPSSAGDNLSSCTNANTAGARQDRWCNHEVLTLLTCKYHNLSVRMACKWPCFVSTNSNGGVPTRIPVCTCLTNSQRRLWILAHFTAREWLPLRWSAVLMVASCPNEQAEVYQHSGSCHIGCAHLDGHHRTANSAVVLGFLSSLLTPCWPPAGPTLTTWPHDMLNPCQRRRLAPGVVHIRGDYVGQDASNTNRHLGILFRSSTAL